MILRDSHGIAQVKSVTGSKILRILKAHGITKFLLPKLINYIELMDAVLTFYTDRVLMLLLLLLQLLHLRSLRIFTT